MLFQGIIACCLLLLSYCDLAKGRGLPEITNEDEVSTSVGAQGDVDWLLLYQAQPVEDDGGQTNSDMTLRKIQDQLARERDEVARERSEVARERKEVSALKQTLAAALMKMGHGYHCHQSQAVAFTAYLSHELHTKPGQVLKFDKVLYNPGGGMYDIITGAATIQVSGTYLFTVTIEHWSTIEIRCHLVVDGVKQVDVIINPQGKSQQSSNTVVIGLQRGQKVWVVTDEGKLWGDSSFLGTTFAGVLIYGYM